MQHRFIRAEMISFAEVVGDGEVTARGMWYGAKGFDDLRTSYVIAEDGPRFPGPMSGVSG